MLSYRNNLSDEQFGWYLAGLLEGDGHCGEREIGFTFHIYDTNLAYYIKNRIGEGNIYKQAGNCTKLQFSKKEAFQKVINIINGKLYSNYKIEYMKKHNYESRFNINILPPINYTNHSLLNNAFLAGFTDSDGSFDIDYHSNKLKIRYRISQKDTTIINILKSTIGGSIHQHGCSQYQAVSLDMLKIYHTYFNKFPLLSTKYINYIIWKEAIKLKINKIHLTKEGKEEILKLKNLMNKNLFKNLIFKNQ